MLKQLNIFGLVIKLSLFVMLFCSSSVIAKYKSVLEAEFNKFKVSYNQRQKTYKKALDKYEQQLEQNKSFLGSQKQREEYNSLLVIYKQQQEGFYKLSELNRQLKEELSNRQSPFQLVFLGVGLICLIPAITLLIIGTTLSYVFKKPSGQKLTKSGAFLSFICGLSLLLARKYFILAFAGLMAALIFLYFFKKRMEKNML